MTTVAMNNLWAYIQGLSLSRRNQVWLAERLLDASKQEKKAKADPTEMTKEEFFARIEEASKGPGDSMLPGESLTQFLTRQGYEL